MAPSILSPPSAVTAGLEQGVFVFCTTVSCHRGSAGAEVNRREFYLSPTVRDWRISCMPARVRGRVLP